MIKEEEAVVNNTCFILLLCVWQQAIAPFCQDVMKEEEVVISNTCFISFLCVCVAASDCPVLSRRDEGRDLGGR